MEEKVLRPVPEECVRYTAVPSVYEAPEIGMYVGYDMKAVDSRDGTVVACVADVTTDRALAEAMAARFERCGLSPVHLEEVIADLLP